MDYAYIQFGQYLSRLRKAKKITAKQMAAKLELSQQQYDAIEQGRDLPKKLAQVAISELLETDLAEIVKWAVPDESIGLAYDKVTGAGRTSKYASDFDEAVDKMKLLGQNWSWEYDANIGAAFDHLREDVFHYTSFPWLPENMVLLLEILFRESSNLRYLREYKGLFAEGESFADYIARYPVLASFVFSAANTLYFHDAPCKGIEECCNKLSFDQFNALLFMAIHEKGIYGHKISLPYLQEQAEFSSLAALMVRQLKPHLQKYLNADHLYMAAIMQNMGELALLSTLHSSNPMDEGNGIDEKYRAFSTGHLLEHVIYELHPVVGAIIAEKQHYPDEVCEAILRHHERSTDEGPPLKDMDPLIVTMKMIAWYTNTRFEYISPNDTKRILAEYPEVKIPHEEFGRVCLKMCEMRRNLVEVSSTVLEQASPDAIRAGNDSIRQFVQNAKNKGDGFLAKLADRHDPRSTPEYQYALKLKAEHLVSLFKDKLIMESLDNKLGATRIHHL